MPSLNVVALISGGKDSLFSILHCMRNDHRVIALGNLHPVQDEVHELDSFMYQTVGHNLINLIAEALELPLYRQAIIGRAIDTSRSYGSGNSSGLINATDEVESMHSLLQKVKDAHPEIDAVSTGAILSDYQRTRVESVAVRLGLVPLSYLWRYPFLPPYDEAALLRDIAAAGQDSRIVKVASGGLDDSYLWMDVTDTATIRRLTQSAKRFGVTGDGAVLGEGGEYETLTINGPGPLWKHRIEVPDDHRLVQVGDAGTYSIHLKRAVLMPNPQDSGFSAESIRIPDLFDELFATAHSLIKEDSATDRRQNVLRNRISRNNITLSRPFSCQFRIVTMSGETLGRDIATQTRGIMDQLTSESDTGHVIHTTILLRSMDDFPLVNKIYGSHFTSVNPASRVTVACGSTLPPECHISIAFIIAPHNFKGSRQGLHVQSLSYWAPANIGPYSQSISIKPGFTNKDGSPLSASIVYVAGQIPLVPSSMTLHSPDASSPYSTAIGQCALSLQHLFRIGAVMNVNFWLGALAFVGKDGADNVGAYVQAAAQVWRAVHSASNVQNDDDDASEETDFDIWDRTYGRHSRISSEGSSTYRQTVQLGVVPPLFIAEVQTLPRNAPVEWSSIGWSEKDASFEVYEDEDNSDFQIITRNPFRHCIGSWISIATEADMDWLMQDDKLPSDGIYTIYTSRTISVELGNKLRAQVIPCFRVWDKEGRELLAAVSHIVT